MKQMIAAQTANETSPWWDNILTKVVTESRETILTNSFQKTIAHLQNKLGQDFTTWTWNRVHTVEHKHPLGEVATLRSYFNVGPYEISGSNEVINNLAFTFTKEGNHEVKAGPSTRRIIDFSDVENSVSILPTGQSGNPFSKHYDDQAPVSSFVGPEIVDGKPCEGIAATYTAQRSTGYSASPTAKGSSGRRLTYGTVAVNPNVIPYGSLMYITSADGRFVYGYAYAADTGTAMMTGSAFIDLYYETYSESVDNAVIAVNVYVLDSDTAAKYKEENDAILEADNTPGL